MRLLAIDTATEGCSAAYADDNQVIEHFQVDPKGHSRLILTMVESVLVEAGVRRAQIEAVAFDAGPGSFTGIRIGAGVAQGIGLGLDVPVLSVSSLTALAQGVVRKIHRCTAVLPAIDARMDQVYWGRLVRDEDEAMGWRWRKTPQVSDPGEVDVPDIGEVGVGSGWDRYAERLCAGHPKSWQAGCYPRARDIAEIAQRLLSSRDPGAQSIAGLSYVRNNVTG